MSLQAIMVDAGRDAEAEARIALALGLARDFDATVIGVSACPMPQAFAGPFGAGPTTPGVMDAEEQRIAAVLREARSHFHAAAQAHGCDVEWRAFIEAPGQAFVREARAADLLVLSRAAEFAQAEPGGVLMRCGRPVLVVPPGMAALQARCVLVAWNESREARRAVADALPFLVRAAEVAVMAACAKPDDMPAARRHLADVAGFLSRHGVTAATEVALLQRQSASDCVLGTASRLGADLVVAGGFGRPELQEWIFGGVTKDLLARCPVCCLLSH